LPACEEAFHRSRRLLAASDFKRVFDGARRSTDRAFTVLRRNNGLGHSRLGLAISKKYCGSAVGRNRIKRAIRESFRRNQDQLQGWDIVVINRRAAAGLSNKALRASLQTHWDQQAEPCKD
jgi:ribonuclease P protein component